MVQKGCTWLFIKQGLRFDSDWFILTAQRSHRYPATRTVPARQIQISKTVVIHLKMSPVTTPVLSNKFGIFFYLFIFYSGTSNWDTMSLLQGSPDRDCSKIMKKQQHRKFIFKHGTAKAGNQPGNDRSVMAVQSLNQLTKEIPKTREPKTIIINMLNNKKTN